MELWREILWRQLGAAMDMLQTAILACPEPLWGDRERQPEFWYLVYHTLFWLDHDVSDSAVPFAPPAPFTLDEMDPAGLLPDRVYAKDEMLAYLEHGRASSRAAISGITDEDTRGYRGCERINMSAAEMVLYELRHIQHHTAQLNLLMRQSGIEPPRWVKQTKILLRSA